MRRPRYMRIALPMLTYFFFFIVFGSSAAALTCNDVRQLIYANYLRLHFSAHEFSDELSEKTLTAYVKALDPGKVYFLQADVDVFMQKHVPKLASMIKKADCSAIDVLFSLYSKRFSERYALIQNLIEVKHDFTIDEYLDLDRKKQNYAVDDKDIAERWRQRLKFQYMQLLENLTEEDKDKKVKEKLHKRYQLLQKRHEEMNTDDVYGIFLDAFSSALDPHTDYFSPSQLEEFRISTRLSLEGIGALLRSEDGFTSIQSLIPGGAAHKSGKINVEDKIVAVAQANGPPVDVIDMDLKDVVNLIRGPGGTEVRLTLRRDGKEIVVPLIREKIQLQDRAAKSKVYEVKVEADGQNLIQRVGVIDLPSFYIDFEGRQANKENFRSSSRDMLNEIRKLQKELVDAIVVDLRSNGGGSLDEAINVAGLFSGNGPVVQIKGQDSKPYVSQFQGDAVYKGPLVILVDRQSASASEILAGAIKDYERGLIVGDTHTFGKGTVQNLNDLDPKLGAIKVTISKFYRPSGASTQLKGVDSDIVIPSISDIYEVGEKYYDFALPWAKIDEVEHFNFNLVKPYLPTLAQESAARVKESPKFLDVAQAIEKYNKSKDDRLKVSLKEKTPEEKAKDEKERKELEEKEKSLERDDYGNIITKISEDPGLLEAVYIAVDYARLLNKEKLGKLALVLPPNQDNSPSKIISSSPGSAGTLEQK